MMVWICFSLYCFLIDISLQSFSLNCKPIFQRFLSMEIWCDVAYLFLEDKFIYLVEGSQESGKPGNQI